MIVVVVAFVAAIGAIKLLDAQQMLTLECTATSPTSSKCVSTLPMAVEKHSSLLWVEQLGTQQKVYKVSVEGRCYVVFETALNHNGYPVLGVSSQPTSCQ